MKKTYFLLIISAVIILVAIFLRFSQEINKNNQGVEEAVVVDPIGEEAMLVGNDKDSHGCIASAGYSWCEIKNKCLRVWEESCQEEESIKDLAEVLILSPVPNEIVESPLIVRGEARGSWFFEANLPIKLVSDNGDVIISHYGSAESDWMTNEFVPFFSAIEFDTTATSGYLVISKDNPSGLPENDAFIKQLIRFK